MSSIRIHRRNVPRFQSTKRSFAVNVLSISVLTISVWHVFGSTTDAQQSPDAPILPTSKAKPAADESGKAAWHLLLNGRDLTGWQVTQFGGQGDVKIHDGVLELAGGSPLTGITYTGHPVKGSDQAAKPFELPTCNYELRWMARRVEGTDFFCGLTFPYKSSHASLILGGWGGSVLGISCIDSYDAAENETTRYRKFEQKRWYAIRLRVTDGLLEAWIDDDRIIDCDLDGRELKVRSEVELSRPLGIASFDTQAEFKKLEIRRLAGKASDVEDRSSEKTDQPIDP